MVDGIVKGFHVFTGLTNQSMNELGEGFQQAPAHPGDLSGAKPLMGVAL
jgi:hypothetical protein